MMTGAVVVAAGQGRRMAERWEHSPLAGLIGAPVAKQFLPLCGKPVVAHALGVFERCDAVDAVVLVVPEADVAYARREVVERFELRKVRRVVAGGRRRQDSVLRGLWGLRDEGGDWDYVIVHDGVRPLVTEQLVLKVLDEAQRSGAATLGVPMRETVKVIGADGLVSLTPDRSRLWLIQTPQAFRFRLLLEAHEHAARRDLEGHDDCTLVEALGEPVRVVLGHPSNIKVTEPEDLVVAEALMACRQEGRGGPLPRNGS
ncbi:MAG TPA: 2-C-methyl-D-erythritol 4-phosphate cytidylyltransferase [Limnochordales bacterium]